MKRIGIFSMAAFLTATAFHPALAAPITTNTALPVAKGEYVFREQVIFNQSGDDPSAANRDHHVALSASVLCYGVTPDLAIFGVLPVANKKLKLTTPGGARVTRKDSGLGDVRAFARYTAYKKNMPGRTFRVAPFAGIELPTGSNTQTDALGRLPAAVQLGSGSWDPFGGLIVTYQTLDFEIDLQASYQANTKADGFEFGDVARFDASLQYRLWPGELSDSTSAFLYGVGELNLINQEKNRAAGISNPNSGGTTLWGLVGLQYVTSRRIIEAGVQLPLVQDLNGTALERDYIVRGSVRFNF
jgi:Putative MetA-pathway of phenol degradation